MIEPTIKRRLRVALTLVVIVFCGSCMFFESKVKIKCKGTVKLHDSATCFGAVNATMQQGEVVTVHSQGYSKDCMYYKVNRSSGEVGYIYFGDPFEVIQNEKVILRSPGNQEKP